MAKPCIYCATGKGTTVDHVPPRCFYPAIPPSNLITVPCCESCRVLDAANDAYVRNLIISLWETENHPDIVSELTPKKNDSFLKDKTNIEALLNTMPRNEHGGVLPLFNINRPEFDRFFERVSRAVLYTAFKKQHFYGTFKWKRNLKELPYLFKTTIEGAYKRTIGDIFAYITMPQLDNGIYYVNLNFYNGLFIVVEIHPIQ